MRRLADLGFHASLRAQGQGIIVTQATCTASLWLSSPTCFQFMFPMFSWYPCLHFLQPICFSDESAQLLGGAGRRKGLGVTSGRVIPGRWAPTLLFLLKAIIL